MRNDNKLNAHSKSHTDSDTHNVNTSKLGEVKGKKATVSVTVITDDTSSKKLSDSRMPETPKKSVTKVEIKDPGQDKVVCEWQSC
jgi:hypothetical protein